MWTKRNQGYKSENNIFLSQQFLKTDNEVFSDVNMNKEKTFFSSLENSPTSMHKKV